MSVNLKEISQCVNGKLLGDETLQITGLSGLDDAQEGDISFLSSPRYQAHLGQTKASAVMLTEESAAHCGAACIVVKDPYLAYALVSELFDDSPFKHSNLDPQVHASVVLGSGVSIGDGVSIGANCTIEDNVDIADGVVIGAGCVIGASCEIGAHSQLSANVTLYHKVKLGQRVAIHSGSVIGADGFGYAPSPEGWQKIYQLGSVIIGDDVSVGACTSIDRGALQDTIISDGVIIDNQVQIAHNVIIGKNTALAGCVGIAGSATIGANCTLGGGVGVAGHLTIADNVHLTGMTLVSKSINTAGVYSSGTALSSSAQWRKNAVRFLQLDKLHKRVVQLEKALPLANAPQLKQEPQLEQKPQAKDRNDDDHHQ